MPKHELPPPEEDGLRDDAVREWSIRKHYFLARYLDAFTTAMRRKPWSGLHYIDLFAGSGIVSVDQTGQRYWGSPLIAAHNVDFKGIHLCEKDAEKFQALQARVNRLPHASRIHLHHGDANALVQTIMSEIPARSLSVAFLDPYGLHLNFETVRVLAKHRVDLIVFFPDHLDALRNWNCVYHSDLDSNLDKVLGKGVDWRAARENVPQARWADMLRRLYEQQIKQIGYSEFRYERIANRGRPLYVLILCARHPAAAKIWDGISSIKPDGQRTLDFGD